jgi:hypothetical protein
MENQEPKKAPETTAEFDASDRSPGQDRGAEVKSDASSHQNVEVEKEDSPGQDRDPQNVEVEKEDSPGQDRDP